MPVSYYYTRSNERYVEDYPTLIEAMMRADQDFDTGAATPAWVVDEDGTEYDPDAIMAWNMERATQSYSGIPSLAVTHRSFKGDDWQEI